MKDFRRESLCHDPIHGYIPFVSVVEPGESSERMLLDHRWVQRMRQIHQLQTAWWVYPSAEHTRFQHVVGAMHMASRMIDTLYSSLAETCPDLPSHAYVECLTRMAALLHDVGHGPFGHFFDAHFLQDYGLTHETLGAHIIRHELGPLLGNLRCCPNRSLAAGETLDPEQIAWLIMRPTLGDTNDKPRWLVMLRSLFCGLYTVDNMDFVMRDAYMTGYSQRVYDLDRLLRYSFFSPQGLTIHERGLGALIRFRRARSELFRAIYFHRTVRAIDKTLEGLFRDSKQLLFPGNPLEYLDDYQQFTEWSLLVDVARWPRSEDARERELGLRWQRLLSRQVDWVAIDERSLVYGETDTETGSIFSDASLVDHAIRDRLPEALRGIEMQVDLPRHIDRPDPRTAAAGQNFLYLPATGQTGPLTDDQLYKHLPISQLICRIYLRKAAPPEQATAVARALDALLGSSSRDDLTNM
jgi:hypothetical protein